MEFIRFGSLSPRVQDFYHSERKECRIPAPWGACFHCPPARKGIYAMPLGHIDHYLVSWKRYDKQGNLKAGMAHPRHFRYRGKVWTHLFVHSPEITYWRRHADWLETDTDGLEQILRTYMVERLQLEAPRWDIGQRFHPFMRNDIETEVFIERIP